MGRSSYKFFEEDYPYFITSTLNYGIPLFSDQRIARIVLNSIQFIQDHKKAKVYAYVIMENHIHMIFMSEKPSNVMKSFKSFTARKIINSLDERKRRIYLGRLRFHKKFHKKKSTYQVWEEGVHPIQIDNPDSMERIINYIHYNPVKAGYVDKPTEWRYSSARNYSNQVGLIKVTLYGG